MNFSLGGKGGVTEETAIQELLPSCEKHLTARQDRPRPATVSISDLGVDLYEYDFRIDFLHFMRTNK
jgi:hypothetical protein